MAHSTELPCYNKFSETDIAANPGERVNEIYLDDTAITMLQAGKKVTGNCGWTNATIVFQPLGNKQVVEARCFCGLRTVFSIQPK